MFLAITFAVFFASFAMMVREGIWSNAITLINTILSGLVAYGFYAPLVVMIDEQTDGSYTYLLDFLCLWLLFVVTMVIMRTLTDKLSRTRLRLKHPLDAYGGPLVGVVAAWVVLGFTLSTMHTAPLAQDALGGKLVYSDEDLRSKSSLTTPDLGWLRFVERVGGSDALGTGKFTAGGFVKIHAVHRKKLETAGGLRVRRG